jgi:hypothetical protein
MQAVVLEEIELETNILVELVVEGILVLILIQGHKILDLQEQLILEVEQEEE